jgi:hypothetical protein
MSNNFHAYTNIYDKLVVGSTAVQIPAHAMWYTDLKLHPYPLVSGQIDNWSKDLRFFLMELDCLILKDDKKRFEQPPVYRDPFFRTVVHPMVAAYAAHKQDRRDDALKYTGLIKANDWALACTRWLERRYDRRGARGKGKKTTDGGELNREP